MNDLDTLIGPALRERLRTELPDLEHLASVSLKAGRRRRRRRRAVAVTGGAAALALVGVALSQTGGSTAARDPEVAQTASATPTPSPTPSQPSLPVGVTAAGWDCEAFVVDEKMWCTRGGLGVSIVVRPRSSYDDWKGSPDKEGSAEWMSPLHGNYFVTVQGGPEPLRPAVLDELVAGLTFADTWERP